MKKYLLILFGCSISFFSFSQKEKRSILFIGNSYTYYNELPQICSSIAATMGDVLVTEQSTYGGYKLEQHLQRAETIAKIVSGIPDYNKSKTRKDWDYVVFQEYSQFPSANEADIQKHILPAVKSLDSLNQISNPSSKLLFYQSWGRKNGDKLRCEDLPDVCTYEGMDSLTAKTYERLALQFNGEVVPVGAVWHFLRNNHSNIELYNIDESHPSEAGSFAAACTFYAVIFQKDPRKIPFDYLLDFDTSFKIKNSVYQILTNRSYTLH